MIDTGRLTTEQTRELFRQLLYEMATDDVVAELEAHLEPEVKRTIGETWFEIDDEPEPTEVRRDFTLAEKLSSKK